MLDPDRADREQVHCNRKVAIGGIPNEIAIIEIEVDPANLEVVPVRTPWACLTVQCGKGRNTAAGLLIKTMCLERGITMDNRSGGVA
jgi:hypothetical protein